MECMMRILKRENTVIRIKQILAGDRIYGSTMEYGFKEFENEIVNHLPEHEKIIVEQFLSMGVTGQILDLQTGKVL